MNRTSSFECFIAPPYRMWWYSRLEYSILKWISPSSASSPAACKHFLGDTWVNYSGKRSTLVPIITLLCLLPFSYTCTLYFKRVKEWNLPINILIHQYYYLLYRHEHFTGKYTTRKIHKNYIRDLSGLFSIISHVSLSMT